MTGFVKFGWPILFCALTGNLLAHAASAPLLLRCLVYIMSPCLAFITLDVLWCSYVIKRVELEAGILTVSNFIRTAAIPITEVVNAAQSRWPKHNPVKLTLKKPCLGKLSVYFLPSASVLHMASRKKSFWHQPEWHPHPIVDELNQMILESTEQVSAPSA